MKKSTFRSFVAISALLTSSYSVYGATDTWTGSTDATWANSGNWSGGTPSTADTALFNATITNGNGTTSPVVIDSGRTVKSITFDTAAASAYTIGATAGNPLTLATTGTLSLTSTVVNAQTINAPLIIGGATASTYSFSNSATAAGATLTFGGPINGAATSGNTVLTLTGVAGSPTNTINGVIGDGTGGGTMGLSIASSTWALTQANLYTGGTTLSGGTLLLGTNTSLSSGTLTASGGTLAASTVLSNLANNITQTGTVTIGGTNAITFSGNLTNSAGNRTLTASDTGGATFSGGNIYLSELTGTGRTWTVNGTGPIVINDVISNFNGAGTAGSFTYSGTGSLTLGGNNTYTGLTTISSGTVTITGNETAATGGLTMSGGTLNLNSTTALGTGTLLISGTSTLDNTSGGSITEGNNPIITLSGSVNFGGTNNLNMGTGTVTTTSDRIFTLGAGNNTTLTFGGTFNNGTTAARTFTVNAGTGTGETLIFNNGLNLQATGGTTNIIDIFSGTGNLTINGGVANGTASDVNGLTYNGSGILTLSSASTYTGNTLLSGSGTLVLGNNASMGTTGTFTASAGTLSASSALTNIVNNFVDTGTMTIGGSNAITVNGTFTEDSGNNRTLTNNDSGGLTLGGNVYLSNSSGQGRILTIGGTGNTVIGGVISNFNGSGLAGGLTYAAALGSSGSLSLSGNNTYTGTTTLNNGTLATTLATNGTPFGTGGMILAHGTLSLAPSGTGNAIVYTGANLAAATQFVVGGTSLGGGGILSLNKGSETSVTYTVGNSAATGNVFGRNGTHGTLIIAPSAVGNLGVSEIFNSSPTATGQTFTTPAAAGMIVPWIIGYGVTTANMGDFLTYGGAGFTGFNSAAPNYVNTSGTIGAGTIAANKIININGNATFTANPTNNPYAMLVQSGDTATINTGVTVSLSGSGGLILNGGNIVGGTLAFGGTEGIIYGFNGTSTIGSSITGTAGLTFGGSGTVILNGVDANTGAIAVNNGTLTLLGTVSSSSTLAVFGGTLNLNNSDLAVSGTVNLSSVAGGILNANMVDAISGSAALTVAGTANLSQANNYTGATTVNNANSVLNLTSAGAINGSAIAVSNGVMNVNAANAITGTSSLTVSSTGVVNITQSENYTGATTNTGTINFSGSGSLGNTAIRNQGTLVLGSAGAIDQNTLNAVVGSSLTETANDAISGTAALTIYSNATVTLSHANNYSGLTTVYGDNGSNAGGLVLDFTQAASPVTNILNNGISHANIGTGTTVAVSGGRITMNGKAGTANSQEFNGLNVLTGQSTVNVTAGAGGTSSLILNAITRNTGGTVDFGTPASTTITTTNSNFNGTPSGGQQTILGGWATVGGSTWATVGAGGVITGLASTAYVSSTGGTPASAILGKDVDAGGGSNSTSFDVALTAVNSIRYASGSSEGKFFLNNDLVIASGGILVNNGVITNTIDFASSAFNVTSGNGQDLVVTTTNGSLIVWDNITDNGGTSIGLTKSGTGNNSAGNGVLYLNGTNTFTGPLTINAGTVQLGSSAGLGADALDGAPVVVFGSKGVVSGSLSLNGNSVTISGLMSTGATGSTTNALNAGTMALYNGNATTAAVLTVDNNVNDTFEGAIMNGSGSASLGLTKNGIGTLTLSGYSAATQLLSYTGATTINQGELYLTGPGTGTTNLTGTSSVTVSSGASFGTLGTVSVTVGNTGGTFTGMTVAGGGAINLVDGLTGGGLTITGATGATTLTIGDSTAAGMINLDVGSSTDSISLGNSTLIDVGVDGIVINLSGLGTLNTAGTQNILTTGGFAAGSSISAFNSTTVGVGKTVSLGTTTGNFDGFTVSLGFSSANVLSLVETANTTPTTAYFSGASGTGLGGGNAWNSFTGGNSNISNWSSVDSSGSPANINQKPGGGTTDVIFGSAPTNSTALANYQNNVLGADFSIKGLIYNGNASGNITTSGANNLTIGTDGITDSAVSGTQTIATSLVTLGTSQTWTVNNNLVVNSSVTDSGGGFSITKTGTGALTLAGPNVYSGGTVINQGVLYANSATSSTGDGLVSVTGGALSGLGTIRPVGGTTASVGITVASGATLAPGVNSMFGGPTVPGQSPMPYLGVPGTQAVGSLTLDTSKFAGTTGINLSSGAGLTFALGAGNTSSTLIVGATTVNFGGNVVTINDLVGANLTLNSEYTLIDGTSSTVYNGLVLGASTSQGTLIVGGLSLLIPSSSGTNFFADYYKNSELFLTSGNDIDVFVIPEPGTWALMIGGFALLIFIQRRKRKLD